VQYGINVDAVAKQMAATVKAEASKFLVNTGDNFYWCGLKNTSDFQLKDDWLTPYGSAGLLDLPWYSVLGNHEYGYNVQAQIDMGKEYKTWILDDRCVCTCVGGGSYVDGVHCDVLLPAVDTI
jgi:hypothetical protein